MKHLNLIHIQNQLAFLKSKLSKNTPTQKSDLIHLRRLIHEYGKPTTSVRKRICLTISTNIVTAIKDFQYMSNLSRIHNVGISTSLRTLLDSFFASISRSRNSGEPYDSALLGFPRIAVTDDDRVRELLRKHLWRRFSWSKEERESSAESSLTLNPSTTKRLITVSVAVMLFALLMSLRFAPTTRKIWRLQPHTQQFLSFLWARALERYYLVKMSHVLYRNEERGDDLD